MRERADLKTVADAEDGDTKGENVRVDVRGIVVVDRVGRAGKDDSFRTAARERGADCGRDAGGESAPLGFQVRSFIFCVHGSISQ